MQPLSHILPLIWSCDFPLSWLLLAIFMPQSAPWYTTFGDSLVLQTAVVGHLSRKPRFRRPHWLFTFGGHLKRFKFWWELWLGKGNMIWKERMAKKVRQQEQRIVDWKKKSCYLCFIWGNMRNVAQETAPQIALSNCSKEVKGRRIYMWFR